MSYRRRFLMRAASVLVLFFALGEASALADPAAMSAEEYKLYQEYRAALEDPRVQNIPDGRKLPAIARNFRVSEARLRRIVSRGEQVAESLVEENQTAVRTALERSPVGPQIASVDLLDQSGTVVAYVSWRNAEKDRLPVEASWVAKKVAEAAPLASVVAVWSCTGKTKVFTATIRTSAAERISESRIEDFAATRYLRLFEDVRNVWAGSPPTDTDGCQE